MVYHGQRGLLKSIRDSAIREKNFSSWTDLYPVYGAAGMVERIFYHSCSTIYFSKYFFLTIPKEFEDYSLFGKFHVNAKNALWRARADDSILNFSL